MSHSIKKTPVYKDGSNQSKRRKYNKRQANKKVRKWAGALRKSNEYRKIWEQWDICDYRFYEPFSCEYLEDKNLLNWWKKWYYRK